MEGELIEKEEDEEEEEEEEECDPEVVPFITQKENLQRQSQQSQYFQSGNMQQDFYIKKLQNPSLISAIRKLIMN